MSTDILKTLGNQGTHAVGTLNTPMPHVETVPHGAVAIEAIDNYTIVEVDGYDEYTGKPKVKSLTGATKEGYLIASVAQRFLGEDLSHFYNDAGEDVRIIVQKKNLRFQTSAYELNTENVTNGGAKVSALAKGQVAHFNPTTKKFMISDATSPATAYGTAANKYVVVGTDMDTAGQFSVPTIRLSVAK